MSPVHLSDFKRNCLSYRESDRRFCLMRDTGTHLRAFNIDISGAGNQYFKSLYGIPGLVGRRSADGIYVGNFYHNGKQFYFVVVIELEGLASSFEEAVDQVRCTLQHFSNNFNDPTLSDDGMRHHHQATSHPRPYIAKSGHLVAGIVVGSRGRLGDITFYQGYPIICLGSRDPVQERTPESLFEEIAEYTGQSL